MVAGAFSRVPLPNRPLSYEFLYPRQIFGAKRSALTLKPLRYNSRRQQPGVPLLAHP